MKFRIEDTDIAVTHSDRPSLLDAVGSRLADGQGFALATVNLDHIVKLSQDRPFRQAYAAQDFVVADGNPIVWLSRLAGRDVRLVTGADLVLPLATAAARNGRPFSIIGATQEALDAAASRLRILVPGLTIGLLYAPPMEFVPDGPQAQDVLRDLALMGPGLCLIALGAPKQEIFAALGRRIAPQAGFASVGAGVEFISGHQTRAPAWVRAIAMEWLWRAMLSPRRLLPRYAACLAILPAQMLQALRQRSSI